MAIVTNNVFNESLISTLTEKNTNGGVLMRFAHLVIKYFHVHLQLTYIGRLEHTLFQFHYNHAVQFPIEKE